MAKNYSNYRKKRRKSKLRTKSRKRFRKGPNPFSILFIIIIVTVFIWSINPLNERFKKKQETVSLEQKISSVREKNKLLEEELIRLQGDDSYYEEWARKNLFLAKPGESVYSLVGVEDKKDAAKDKKEKSNDDKVEDDNNIWEKIKLYFYKVKDEILQKTQD